MTGSSRHIICFVYNSYRDPLSYGLMVKYLVDLRDTGINFHLITFEQEQFKLSAEEIISEKEKLQRNNIYWYPHNFKTGRFLLLKKSINLFQGSRTVARLKRRYQPELIMAFANVAGCMSYIYSRLWNIPLCIYSYEPHFDYLVELGLWKRNSLKYRIMHSLEWRAGRKAEYIFTGTKFMVEKLHELGAKGQIRRLPTSVDEDLFQFSEEKRQVIRRSLNLGDRPVFIYPGKFGDLYMKEEIADFCGAMNKRRPDFFFIFLTGTDPKLLLNWLLNKGIDKHQVFIRRIPYEDVPGYLSAADIALVGIANMPSRIYSSPTKVGEYLMCGLPYIVREKTSEDDLVAKEYNVGCVVKDFNSTSLNEVWPQVEKLLSENKQMQRERCRKAGLEYRSKKQVSEAFHELLKNPIARG